MVSEVTFSDFEYFIYLISITKIVEILDKVETST